MDHRSDLAFPCVPGPRSIRALDESTWPAFVALVEHCGGFPSGCWCMAFHEKGADKHEMSLNRERKRTRVVEGTAHAALVFDGDPCVGLVPVRPD